MLPSARPGVALRDEIEELEEDTASSAANPNPNPNPNLNPNPHPSPSPNPNPNPDPNPNPNQLEPKRLAERFGESSDGAVEDL